MEDTRYVIVEEKVNKKACDIDDVDIEIQRVMLNMLYEQGVINKDVFSIAMNITCRGVI